MLVFNFPLNKSLYLFLFLTSLKRNIYFVSVSLSPLVVVGWGSRERECVCVWSYERVVSVITCRKCRGWPWNRQRSVSSYNRTSWVTNVNGRLYSKGSAINNTAISFEKSARERMRVRVRERSPVTDYNVCAAVNSHSAQK